MDDQIMVSVVCTTYNQEKYIARCLDSLVSQVTNFKYEIIVHDDASTDRTQSIIKEYAEKYPEEIRTIFQEENLHSKGIISWGAYIFPQIRGKYVAKCEGDDFWVDEKKLQKQFDLMEAHPEYVLCGHAAYYANEDGSIIKNKFFNYGKGNRELTTEDLISGWSMATNSMLYLTSVRGADPIPFKGNALNGDLALMLYLSLKGKVYYIDELLSAYRQVSIGSITWNMRRDPEKNEDITRRYIQMLQRLDEYTKGKYKDAIEKKIETTSFNLAISRGDVKIARKYIDLYHEINLTSKVKLYLKHLFPQLYRIRTNARKKFRRKI